MKFISKKAVILWTMIIDILSPLPHLLKAPFTTSILAKAIEKKIVEIHIHDLRDYAKNSKKQT